MKNPIQVFVGSLDLAAVHTVTQKVYLINEEEKNDTVNSIFIQIDKTNRYDKYDQQISRFRQYFILKIS